MSEEEILKVRKKIEELLDELPSWQGNYIAARNHLSIAIDYLNQEIGEMTNHD